MLMFYFRRRTGPIQDFLNSGNLERLSCVALAMRWKKRELILIMKFNEPGLARLAGKVQLFDAGKHELPEGVSLPEKDVPILLAAIEARATHLLTGDLRHFGSYFGKRVEGILVLHPGKYLRRYED